MEPCSDVLAVSSGLEALTRSVQYVDVSVLPFSGWFFTCSRARLYKNMEEENTIFMGETLRCLAGTGSQR